MISIDTSKLSLDVKSWYETAEENDKIAALNIGYNIICSDTYNKNSDNRSLKLQQHIDNLNHKLNLLKKERDEEQTSNANESLNRIMTQPIVQAKQQQINSMSESNKQVIDAFNSEKRILKESIEDFKLKLKSSEESNVQLKQSVDLARDQYNELNQQIKCSKIKGNMGEQQIQIILEEAGYIIKKWGNKAGDIAVYSKDDPERLILCIEAKNYDTNPNKLGKNGKETDKFYRDIKEQLESKKSPVYQNSNVPWMFISLKLQIPNVDSLIRQYLGVNCFYVSEPTTESLIASIEIFDAASYVFTKNTQNENYVKTKISELYSLQSCLDDDMYDFNLINKNIDTLKKNISKQEDKLKRKLSTIKDSVLLITNDIENPLNSSNGTINYDVDLVNLPYSEMVNYIKQLQFDAKHNRMKDIVEKTNIDESNLDAISNVFEIQSNEHEQLSVTEQAKISENTSENNNDLSIFHESNNLNGSNNLNESNKDSDSKINKKKDKLVSCNNCGREVAKKNLSRHKKTNKCNQFVD